MNLAIVGFGATSARAFGPLIEIAHVGIRSEFANLVHAKVQHPSNEFLFAIGPIGDHVTQEAQLVLLDHSAELIEIDIHPGRFWVRGLCTCRCLLHTEAVGTVAGEVEPS